MWIWGPSKISCKLKVWGSREASKSEKRTEEERTEEGWKGGEGREESNSMRFV